MGETTVNIQGTLKEMQSQGEKAAFFRIGSPNPGQQGAPPIVMLSLLKDDSEVLSTITLDLEAAKNLKERLTYHIERAQQNLT